MSLPRRPSIDAWRSRVRAAFEQITREPPSRLWREISTRGLAGSWQAASNLLRGRTGGGDPESLYRLWLRAHALLPQDLARMDAAVAAWGDEAPRIGIATPLYDTPSELLARCAASVRAQRYGRWEWYVYDDGSSAPHLPDALARLAASDPRIRVARGARNLGIAAACNAALALGDAPFVGWLDHDDELAPDALFEVASRLRAQPGLDVVYSDEDKLEQGGRRSTPFFKPDWSPEYLRSCMYIAHFSVYRRSLLEAVGGFREGFDGAQDYDLMLRVSERRPRVGHVPRVLYHWRKHAASTAAAVARKPGAAAAGRRALAEHLARCGRPGTVEETAIPGIYRARPGIAGAPAVSIVIPSRDRAALRRCLESVARHTEPRPCEIVVVDGGGSGPQARADLEGLAHRAVHDPAPFNFSRRVNRGVAEARGEYVVLLDDAVEARDPGWCTALLEWCQDPEVGAVGAKLCGPDGRIAHAGLVLGAGGVAGPVGRLAPRQSFGYLGTLLCVRNYSAVSPACLMVSRADFDAVGGFDERLARDLHGVDFCLRLGQAGRRVVWTPHAELIIHPGEADQPPDATEIRILRERWGERLASDPCYNENLSLERADFRLRL